MAEEVSASRVPPTATSNPKTESKTDTDATQKSDAVTVTEEPSESMTPSSPQSSHGCLKKFRSFTPIPVPFRSPNVKDKSDSTSANDVDTPTKAPKLFADREILSKHQLPISQ